MRGRPLIIALLLITFIVAIGVAEENTYQQEGDRLALELSWQEGSVVADIGAGRGELTLIASKRVGSTGRVYATEIEPQKLALLEALAAKDKNISPRLAGESQTNLPADCCDSIFMRLVYHHFTKPAEIDASLFRSLKRGGLLAVIDREPPSGSKRVDGVPTNRVGHGMPQNILIEELTAAGFQVVKTPADWPSKLYCVIFRKPGP
jgi:ubiquinone/menaquinone biosynthesis C-methylase UbiE